MPAVADKAAKHRLELIRAIEKQRGSRVVTCVFAAAHTADSRAWDAPVLRLLRAEPLRVSVLALQPGARKAKKRG